MNPNLPRTTTFSEVATLLGAFNELGYASWSLRVRTVAFKLKDAWYHYATSAHLTEGKQHGDKLIAMRGSLALVERTAPIIQALTAQEFSTHLTHWRAALKQGSDAVFQEHVILERNSSDYHGDTWPRWYAQLYEQGQHMAGPIPDGPFFDPKERLFGKDVPRIAMQFLGESRFAQLGNAPNEYILRVPDRRARIAELDLEGNTLRVDVENSARCALYCSVVTSAYGGQLFHDVVSLENEHVSIDLPFAPENLEVWIVLPDGYMLDYYEETPHRSTWGPVGSLLNSPNRSDLQAIGAALAQGENDSVEFKPYISVKPRDKKAYEILRAVSGFANTRGGDLYIGVNDAAEPEGIEIDLNRDYGEQNRDLPARQAAYEKDLRKLINEGTSPTLPIRFQWHDIAHRTILQVRIPQSTIPVHISENGEMFRRAGATNRKWRAVDALASTENRP